MNATVFQRLTSWLDGHGVPYETMRHEPVYTSEDAARVRGTTLASGAKALVCKTDRHFVLFVLPADCRLASKPVRQVLGFRSLRFATRDEVHELTGLAPGSIPPFGSLFGLPTYCDQALSRQTRINFNAGDHCISISMTYGAYQAVEQPMLGEFATSR